MVSPLEWGLGHATRCVPVIRCLLECRYRVLLVITPSQHTLLQPLFEDRVAYRILRHPVIHYRFSFGVSMLLQIPAFLRILSNERKTIRGVVAEFQPDLIISDNRYGFWSSKVPSVILCHQLNLQTGGLSRVGNALHRHLLKRFAEVWVPDFQQTPQLSGALGHPPPKGLSVRYIGALSRLHDAPMNETVYDLLAILSGPEPERSKLEQLVIQYGLESGKKLALIRGTTKPLSTQTPEDMSIMHLAQPREIEKLVSQSRTILCRSGYSSLCDLLALQRKAVLIPTPGQGEQEYLATWFAQQFGFLTCKQEYYSLANALCRAENADSTWPAEASEHTDALLKSAFKAFGL